MRRITKKNKKYIITIIINLLSILLLKYPYISITLTLLSLIINLKYNKSNKKIYILITIISTILILINSILIYKDIKNKTDVYKDQNILLGSWIYNEYNGKYIFNKDNTYTQYSNSDTTNNYCKGTYKYSYGASTEEGITIRQDENYYFYTLTLKENYCIIMDKKIEEQYTKNMVFSIDKNKENEIIVMNTENKNIFKMLKES